MVDTITAATIAAVDLHLAHLGLYPRSEPASSHDIVNPNRPRATSASVATLPPLTGSVVPTTHPSATLPNNAFSLLNPESPRMTLTAHIRDMERNPPLAPSRPQPPTQGNGRWNASGTGNARSHNRDPTSTPQGNSTGFTHATNVAAAPTQPLAPLALAQP